jgi:hypothetical protein
VHQPLERRHHLGPQRRHGLVQFFVHTFHPFCDSFHSLYYRTIAPAPQAPSSAKKVLTPRSVYAIMYIRGDAR